MYVVSSAEDGDTLGYIWKRIRCGRFSYCEDETLSDAHRIEIPISLRMRACVADSANWGPSVSFQITQVPPARAKVYREGSMMRSRALSQR
ncbi:hypothetical protein DICSQDRAFT_139411 [Dichomitus squalens LYAD-421 SS1]|uniref:Uncharacterized protein n=2 Tax=Dichomitus squalens TaxID=114155 RepID=A0A4Q9PWG4_9APHY|nr:uncharacterized protein DICSQDRAFT_139411 [Dichomitus squalens LYAD-421 SS1]EJF58488.1 hypothetical protein DICSQDRAFT_139411 [Dichomitus squalens LYAD-421 SS1]TBU58850.1 hypothetical protein BD310DRAFT_926270 [Dichomitus squalens]